MRVESDAQGRASHPRVRHEVQTDNMETIQMDNVEQYLSILAEEYRAKGSGIRVLYLDINQIENKQKMGFIYPLILTIWTITK